MKQKKELKVKRTSHGAALKIADREFSRYRRSLSCIETGSLADGLFKCVTCGRITEIMNGDCGHCLHRKVMATRFSVVNTAGQCYTCNKWGGGEVIEFERVIEEQHGAEELARIKQASLRGNRVTKFSTPELLELARSYRDLTLQFYEEEGIEYPWKKEKIPSV